jgi:hypothetical protein
MMFMAKVSSVVCLVVPGQDGTSVLKVFLLAESHDREWMLELDFLVSADLDIPLAWVADGDPVEDVGEGNLGQSLVSHEIFSFLGDIDDHFLGSHRHWFGLEDLRQVDGNKPFLLIELGCHKKENQ